MKFWITSCLLLFGNLLLAQSLQVKKISPSQVWYKGVMIPYENTESIFKEVKQSHNEYLKATRTLKTAKALGYITLSVLGASVVAIAVDNNNGRYCDTFCFTTGDYVGIIGIGVVMPIIGTTSLIVHFSGISHQNKSIQIYNDHIGSQSIRSDVPNLHFGVTRNGIGFVLNF